MKKSFYAVVFTALFIANNATNCSSRNFIHDQSKNLLATAVAGFVCRFVDSPPLLSIAVNTFTSYGIYNGPNHILYTLGHYSVSLLGYGIGAQFYERLKRLANDENYA